MVRGDPAEMEMESQGKSGGVQRYELPDAATSPRQFQFELYKRRIPRDLFLQLVWIHKLDDNWVFCLVFRMITIRNCTNLKLNSKDMTNSCAVCWTM